MGLCLSALLNYNLTQDELFRLPELLSHFSNQFSWYEIGARSMTLENCENLIEEGGLWINGPGNITITPTLESIEVCYGWSYSRFFTAEQGVSNFVEFCTALSKQLGCVKIYFLPDGVCEILNYQQVEQLIIKGELTEGKECNRLSEYYDYEVYVKQIPV